MSLFAALNSAVSGLSAQSSALSAISTNIANASTTGYKTTDTDFDSLVAASTAQGDYGQGVSTSNYQEMSSQGEISSTTTTTNMAIDGAGFFVVSASTSDAASSDDLFTRNGSFSSDANGYLVNSQGDYLLGYATDASGDVTSSSAGTLGGLTAIQVPQTTTVSATTSASLTANLPANADTDATIDNTMSVVDSLGNSQTIDQVWTKTGDNAWTVALSSSDGTVSPSSISVSFNSDGSIATSPSTTQVSLTPTDGASAVSFGWDLSGLTQQASSDSTDAISITSATQNGTSSGSLSSVAVGKDGTITATYSNDTSVVVGKVPLATFADEEGLTEVNGSTYQASTASGSAMLDTAGADGSGTITGEALEASTTDTATEFNKMIVAQQAYSAAAQVVTYVDKMYESLIQAVG